MRDGAIMSRELADKLEHELKEGMSLEKCRKCGCMKDALAQLERSLPAFTSSEAPEFSKNLGFWRSQMEELTYK